MPDASFQALYRVLPDFQIWHNDVVAFLVWEDIRRIAVSGRPVREIDDFHAWMQGMSCCILFRFVIWSL